MTLHFSPSSTEVNLGEQTHDTSLLHDESYYQRVFKRIFDITLVVLALPVALPLIAVAAILVALDGYNPFYSQMRVGQNGQHFRIWKLRTMVHKADTLLEKCLALDPAARREWDNTQKLKKDPRITFFGRFLRKSSIDELPQLFNVLNGTMSLVGPRPMMLNQQSSYPGKRYYHIRPGITGPWQVSDRNNCDFRDRAHYDELYYCEMSFKEDVRLLGKTVSVVLKATGH